MRIRIQSKFLAVTLVMLVVLAACKDSQLGKMASALDTVNTSMSVVQKTTIAANAAVPPLISTPTAAVLMSLCLKIDKATKEAVLATQAVAKLDNKTNANLLGIIQPIAKAVDAVIADPSISSIQDARTRDAIRLALLSVQTSISTTQTILIAAKK